MVKMGGVGYERKMKNGSTLKDPHNNATLSQMNLEKYLVVRKYFKTVSLREENNGLGAMPFDSTLRL